MKPIYAALGLLTFALGCVGLALPMLPSTPFLLLAAFFFAKSSTKLNRWFRSTAIYKNNLESVAKGQGMRKQAKARVLIAVTLLLAVAAYFMRAVPYGLLIIGVVWAAHMVAFLFIVKTAKG